METTSQVQERIRFEAWLKSQGIHHFSAKELRCHQTLDVPPEAWWNRIKPVVEVAQMAREYFGLPIAIPGEGAWRGPRHKDGKGQAPQSRHKEFRALDLRTPRGVHPLIFRDKLREFIRIVLAKHNLTHYGLIYYGPTKNNPGSFCHVDIDARRTVDTEGR